MMKMMMRLCPLRKYATTNQLQSQQQQQQWEQHQVQQQQWDQKEQEEDRHQLGLIVALLFVSLVSC